MNRLFVVGWLLGLAMCPSISLRPTEAATTRRASRPNVLFLFTDDQRADTIAALGNSHIKTPQLDRLVRSGFVFNNAYCMGGNSAAVCRPSRAMMLSGRSLFRIPPRGQRIPNFARSMKQAGYVTYHHGKAGNSPHDIHADFDFSHYLKDMPVRNSGYPGKEAADDAIAFLKKHEGDKPFFVYLAFAGPHDPRVANDEYLAMYDVARMPLPANYLPVHPFDNGDMTIRDEKLAPWPRTRQVIREHLRDYYAVITHMDAQVGRLFAALEETGQFDNTLIVFSSDHGLAMGSHGLMGKQNLYEHSMKSPLVFSGPGIPTDRSSDAYAYLFDIYPTVCDLVGAPSPSSIDGKSLAGIIRGEQKQVRDAVFTAYLGVQRAVRKGRWKLIRYPQINRTQLFDLELDPHEVNDLADDPQYTDKVKQLFALLGELQKEAGDDAPLTSAQPKDERFHPPSAQKP